MLEIIVLTAIGAHMAISWVMAQRHAHDFNDQLLAWALLCATLAYHVGLVAHLAIQYVEMSQN